MSSMSKKKTCSRCKKKKSLSEFYVNHRNKDGFDCWCRDCKKEYRSNRKGTIGQKKANQRYNSSKKGKLNNRKKNLKRCYNMTLEQYDKMFEKQGGVCELCNGINESGKRLCVDHNHETGKIRGLLCHRCNAKLGVMEDMNFKTRVKEYLKKHN